MLINIWVKYKIKNLRYLNNISYKHFISPTIYTFQNLNSLLSKHSKYIRYSKYLKE